jgi:hypothetical protein
MFKAGDKVTKNATRGSEVGTVVQDQSNMGHIIVVSWNGKESAEDSRYLKRVHCAPKEETGILLKEGDRVRLKWNKSGGTVKNDQTAANEHVWVKWDHRDSSMSEKPEDLIPLYTPREREEPHPMQAALDSIGEERERLKKQIEDLQFKLGGLTKAYKMIEEGW